MAVSLTDPVFGIDVSHYQVIDWETLAKAPNLSWIYAKATEGKTFKDSDFQVNVQSALQLGLPIGAYHYARPGNNTAAEDAGNFLDSLGRVGGQEALTLRPMLDFEEANDNVPRGAAAKLWIEEWLARVKEVTGVQPMLYTGPNVLGKLGIKDLFIPDTVLWVPRYPNNLKQSLSVDSQAIQLYANGNYNVDSRLPNWPTDIWQYTGHGRIQGIKNDVDMNITDRDTFARMKTSGGGGMMIAAAAAAAVLLWILSRKRT